MSEAYSSTEARLANVEAGLRDIMSAIESLRSVRPPPPEQQQDQQRLALPLPEPPAVEGERLAEGFARGEIYESVRQIAWVRAEDLPEAAEPFMPRALRGEIRGSQMRFFRPPFFDSRGIEFRLAPLRAVFNTLCSIRFYQFAAREMSERIVHDLMESGMEVAAQCVQVVADHVWGCLAGEQAAKGVADCIALLELIGHDQQAYAKSQYELKQDFFEGAGATAEYSGIVRETRDAYREAMLKAVKAAAATTVDGRQAGGRRAAGGSTSGRGAGVGTFRGRGGQRQPAADRAGASTGPRDGRAGAAGRTAGASSGGAAAGVGRPAARSASPDRRGD